MYFYVYIYLNPTKPGLYKYGEYIFDHEPFYIGKGSGNRLYNHLAPKYIKQNTEKSFIIKCLMVTGDIPIIFKIKENLSSNDAYKLESDMIEIIGITTEQTGPLANKTVCRGGLSYHSEETKRKIGLAGLGRKKSAETIELLRKRKMGKNNPMYKNGKYSKLITTGLNISESKMGEKNPMFGIHLTEEEKLRRSLESARLKSYEITHKDGRIEIITGILRYCRINKLSARAFRRVLHGDRKHYKGMKIKEI